jgi:cytochrome c-type biogenesis protein CcmE
MKRKDRLFLAVLIIELVLSVAITIMLVASATSVPSTKTSSLQTTESVQQLQPTVNPQGGAL